jgi:HlyD family secretion protein
MKNKTIQDSEMIPALEGEILTARRNPLKRWLILAILAILVVIGVMFLRFQSGKGNVTQFKTEEIRRGDLTVIVTATGTLQPTNEVQVGSELSGIIKSVEVDYNNKVKVGQVLAILDTTKLEAQVTQSKSSLESAKAKVLQAQATLSETRSKLAQFQKVRQLSDNKVPSQTEFDAAQASFERAKADEASAKAAVSLAQANLDANETDLSKAVIRSPINGIVLTRSVEPGQTVAAAFTTPVLFTLAEDLTRMELHVDVDEADVGKVEEGQDATFTVDAYPDSIFNAKIVQTRYGAKTTSGVVTYETVLKVDNNDLSLRPGMTATADIIVTKIDNAVLVPNSALRFQMPSADSVKPKTGGFGAIFPRPPGMKTDQNSTVVIKGKNQQVWVLKDGQPVAVPVTIGVTDGIKTEILEGDIEPGMSLVVDILSEGK